MRGLLIAAAAGTLLALPACTTSDKQLLSTAYESCRDRSGEARDRCIAAERRRLVLKREASDRACLAEIAEQEDRSAMINGRRTGQPLTEAATGDCEGAIAQ